MNTMLPNKAWILSRSEAKMSDLVRRLEEGAEMLRTAKIANPLLVDIRDLFLELATALKAKDAEIKRLTAELAAAKAALQTHPCILEDGNFDHKWKFVDESFDHEYGTQIEQYYECEHCKATQDYEGDDE